MIEKNIRITLKESLNYIKEWSKIKEKNISTFETTLEIPPKLQEKLEIPHQKLSLQFTVMNKFIAYTDKHSLYNELTEEELIEIIKDTHKMLVVPFDDKKFQIIRKICQSTPDVIPSDYCLYIPSEENINFKINRYTRISTKDIIDN